jgi:transposase
MTQQKASTSLPQTDLPFTAEEWRQTPEQVQLFVLSLLHRVETLESSVTELQEQVNRNSQNSSQPPSSDGPDQDAPKGSVREEGRKRGGQAGHQKHERSLLPLEQVKEVVEVKPSRCRKCGHTLSGEDESPLRHQVTEIPPVQAETTEYQLHRLTCPHCRTTTCAQLPEGVPSGAFGPRLQAMVALLSGRYHLSKRESCQLMDDFFQVELGLGTILKLETRTSEALQEPVEAAQAYVKAQTAVHLDETGWREANQRAWLWVAATQWVVVFLIHSSRGSQVAKQLLGAEVTPIVHSDRWSSYNWIPTHLRQLCWAHLKRDFQAFAERDGPSAQLGEQLLEQLKQIFTLWHSFQNDNITHPVLQERMKPHRDTIGQLLRLGADCPHDKTAGTCRDILKREEALWTFIDHDDVVPTNNFAEQQIRPAVLWRNSSFGTQSTNGSRFVERLMSVVASLKLQKRNVLDYLIDACQAANSQTAPPSFIPVRSSDDGL